ncbi:F-box/LRR-repeat protein 6 [Astyanax mexicanus]|uniref:F-box/LRR-repeat protein 6 n=2 Tax=Astyanax mexicanus TaxID=7994 RepID=A0A8T2MBH6_ASTMX|nr:F-box/LRR-repeat protein 6 [Astyanax mexicanus]
MDSGHPESSAPDEKPVSGPSSQLKAPSSEGKNEEAAAASSQSDTTGPAKRKEPLKRKAIPLKNEKSKKKKKSKIRQPPRPSYTVQHGEDMLLIISNINQFDSVWKPKRKGCKKKKTKTKITPVKKKKCPPKPKVSKAKKEEEEEAPAPDIHVDQLENSEADWGQNLPVEVLVKIFELAVQQDGAVPFLCRVGRVCRLWNCAASSPTLWRSVSIGYCWIEPGKSQLPGTEQKIRNTVDWLAQNRFSQLRDFSLCHWKKHVEYVIQTVAESCPNLQSLKLSYCTGVTKEAFQNLGTSCPSLESINVQHTEFQDDGLVSFVETYGNHLKRIFVTRSTKSDKLLNVLCRGCCPELRVLEINTKLDSGYCPLPICIQALQLGCPKLQIFRLMNVSPIPKMIRNTPSSTPGFPMLEELCIASSAHSFMTDHDLHNVLHGSPRLRVLDLRGCSRVTATGLYNLPCEDLECLYWGLYFNSNVMVASNKGLHMLTQKWSKTLRELDLTNQPFTEEDMEIAMGSLAHNPQVESFRSLNLSGTRITTPALRLLVAQAPALSYLNLSSCRYLPRGLKRVYRGPEDVQQILDKLD